MGELYIETGLSEINMRNYRRILSLDSAMAVVQFDKDGIEYQRKYFISYPDSVMTMRFTANKKENKISYSVIVPTVKQKVIFQQMAVTA